MSKRVTRRGAIGVTLAGLAGIRRALAQPSSWRPSKLIRIVVPQAAGGYSDIIARIFAPYLQERLGQAVIVDNKVGGAGTIGTLEVTRSAPDGHTLLMGNSATQAVAYSLIRDLPYKPDDLAPVSCLIAGPNALIANLTFPPNNVRELVDYLKANPDKINFATPGVGTTPHLAGIWFNSIMGTQSRAVHYRGSPPAMTDLYGGFVQYSFDALVNASEPIRAKRVKVLGVTGAKRFPGLPDVPTLRESMPELANFVTESWVGLFGPKGTPLEIIDALNSEVRTFLSQQEIPQRFVSLGGVPAYGSPDKFTAYVNNESEKWASVVRRENLQIDIQ